MERGGDCSGKRPKRAKFRGWEEQDLYEKPEEFLVAELTWRRRRDVTRQEARRVLRTRSDLICTL